MFNGEYEYLHIDSDEPMTDLSIGAAARMTFTDADVWRLRLTAHAVAHTKTGEPLINGTIAAKALGKHPRTVRRWMSEGRFTPHENRLGDALYLVSEVAAMLDPDNNREETT